jgi:hypothetical protein
MQNYGSPKLLKSQLENFGTPTWESRDKMPFGCWSRGSHKVYYKGESGGFPQVRVVVSFMSPSLPMARPNTNSAPTMH